MLIPKPWGQEEVLEINDSYMLKRLTMHQGKRCSLQFHKQKRETIYVLEGELRFIYGDSIDSLDSQVYKPGESFTVPSNSLHRMEGLTDCVYLEASTPEMDDVVRVEDDFNRSEPS